MLMVIRNAIVGRMKEIVLITIKIGWQPIAWKLAIYVKVSHTVFAAIGLKLTTKMDLQFSINLHKTHMCCFFWFKVDSYGQRTGAETQCDELSNLAINMKRTSFNLFLFFYFEHIWLYLTLFWLHAIMFFLLLVERNLVTAWICLYH